MTHQWGVLDGIVLVLGLTAIVSGGLWLLFSGLIGRTGLWLGRRLHVVPQPALAPPPNPALELVVGDLRRIRGELDHPTPGLAMAKRLGLLQAYDDRLLDACRALEVPNSMAALAPGIRRDAERLRVEAGLEDAGLVMSLRSR